MLQYFCNIPKPIQHLIISEMILGLQKMGYVSGRFNECFLIIFCYCYLQELKCLIACLILLLSQQKTCPIRVHTPVRIIEWHAWLKRVKKIYKLLLKCEMWKKLSKTDSELSRFFTCQGWTHWISNRVLILC